MTRRHRRGPDPTRSRLSVLAVLVGLVAAIAPAPAATAAPAWAPAGEATIRPGVQTITGGISQCTSNFIFYDDSDVYIGQAAHCSMTGNSLAGADPLSVSGPNGCTSESLPIGTPIAVAGAVKPGTLAYNSWITMQETGETDLRICANNDFALVRLDPEDHSRVNPSMPHWGGPTGLVSTTAPGSKVLSFGDSDLRLRISQLSPKEGIVRRQSAGGWHHTVFALTPGIPGDSGSGFLDDQGRAFGVLSTLIFFPQPLHNGVTDLSRAMSYAEANTELTGVRMALGTEPFDGTTGLDPVMPLLPGLLDLLDLPFLLLQDLAF